MNAGEVENPGAFDSDEKTAKTTPVGGGKNPPESSQLIDPDEPIGDDGVNYDVYADEAETNTSNATNDAEMQFSADDIRKRRKTNFFVNIRGAKKLEREAERKHAADERRILAEQRRAEKETAQAEKAAAAKRIRQQNYDDAQEKSARKEVAAEEKRQRKKISAERHKESRKLAAERFRKGAKKFFTNKRNIAIMSCIAVALIVAGALQINWIINVLPGIQAAKEDEKHLLTALDVNAEAYKIYQEKGYDAATEYLAKVVDDYSNGKSDYSYEDMSKIVTYYADFVVSYKQPTVAQLAGDEQYTSGAEDAIVILNQFNFDQANRETKCMFYNTSRRAYSYLENYEKSDEFMNKQNEECAENEPDF